MKATAWVVLGLMSGLTSGWSGCSPEAPPEPDEDAAAAHRSPAASATAWVKVTSPADLALVEIPAEVVGEPGSRSAVAPVFEGQVVEVYVRPGDVVEQDDPIADLSTPEVTRASAVARATREQLALQRKRLDELERLRDQGLIGTKEVFAIQERIAELEAQQASASATLAAAGVHGRTRLQNGILRLRSPSAGTVTDVDAAPGQIRGPADGPLAVIVAEGPARIQASVSGAFPREAGASFVTREGRKVPLNPEPIATAIDPVDGMTRVWLTPRDPDVTLTHGLRGSLEIEAAEDGSAGPQPNLMQVPSGALRLEPDGQAVVLVRHDEGTQEVPVTVESQSGTSALVRSEQLKVGDEVAADPALVLGEPPAGGGHGH